MSGAPIKKPPASPRVSLSGIPVANRIGNFIIYVIRRNIYLFKMKVMFYILWYAPGWEDVTAQYIGGDALSCYRSVPSRERCLGDRKAAGCTLGQCITLAYKMAARWTEGS